MLSPACSKSETFLQVKKSLEDASYIVFDLETTGGNPEKNGITEIFAMRIKKDQPVETFYSLVNPKRHIPPIVRRITGISYETIKNAPIISDVMPKFLDFIGDGVLVSHNTLGDLKFISYYGEKICNKIVDNFFLCTHLLSERLLSEEKDKSLHGLGKSLALSFGEAHRAEEDARLTEKLFQVLLSKLKEKNILFVEEAIRLQGDFTSALRLGWALTSEQVAHISNECGVLSFYDRKKKLIFAISSNSMRSTFNELKNLAKIPKKVAKALVQSHSVAINSSANIVEAVLAENKIVYDNKPALESEQYTQRALMALCFNKTASDSHLFLHIGYIGVHTQYALGVVHDKRKVQQALEKLALNLGLKKQKNGFLVPSKDSEMLRQFLVGSLAQYKSSLGQRSFWAKSFSLLSGSSRSEGEKIKILEELQNEFSVFKLRDFFSVNGVFLYSQAKNSADCMLYPVQKAKIAKGKSVGKNEWRKWLVSDSDGINFKNNLIDISNFSKSGQEWLKDSADVHLVNSTLWLLTLGNQKNSKFYCEFFSSEQITKINRS